MRIFRHLKRGSYYRILHEAKMQCNDRNPQSYSVVDGEAVIIYQSLEDDSIWVRQRRKFFDGRFEEVPVVASIYAIELSEEEAEALYIKQCDAIGRAKLAGEFGIY